MAYAPQTPPRVNPDDFPDVRSARLRDVQVAQNWKLRLLASATGTEPDSPVFTQERLVRASSRMTQLEGLVPFKDIAPVNNDQLAQLVTNLGEQVTAQINTLREDIGNEMQGIRNELKRQGMVSAKISNGNSTFDGNFAIVPFVFEPYPLPNEHVPGLPLLENFETLNTLNNWQLNTYITNYAIPRHAGDGLSANSHQLLAKRRAVAEAIGLPRNMINSLH